MNTADSPVLFSELPAAQGKVLGVACLNSERSLHSLNIPMIRLLYTQLRTWASDDRIAAVFLHAVGEKAFCAGGDVKSICLAVRANGIEDTTALELFSREYRLDFLIHDYPKPLIVWGTGFVMGGGIGLMCGASHRVITETSRLAMPEISIGLYPDVGGSWLLGNLGTVGLFLGLTGAVVQPADALRFRLANHAIAAECRPKVLAELARIPWSVDRHEHEAQVTGVLSSLALNPLPPGLWESAADELESRLADTALEACYQALCRPSGHPWLDKAARTLRAGSPTSAALIHRQWENGQRQTLADTFRQELVLSVQCARHPDFIEGVRALLVDKDQSPSWHPSTLAGVDTAWLDGHYVAPWVGGHPLADIENWRS